MDVQIVGLGSTRVLAKACGVLLARVLAGARTLDLSPTNHNAQNAIHHRLMSTEEDLPFCLTNAITKTIINSVCLHSATTGSA